MVTLNFLVLSTMKSHSPLHLCEENVPSATDFCLWDGFWTPP